MAPYLHAGRRNHVTANTQRENSPYTNSFQLCINRVIANSRQWNARDDRTDYTDFCFTKYHFIKCFVGEFEIAGIKAWKPQHFAMLVTSRPPSHPRTTLPTEGAATSKQIRPVRTNHTRQTGLQWTPVQLVAKTRLVPHFCNTDVLTSVLLHSFWIHLCDIKHKYQECANAGRINFLRYRLKFVGP